MQQNYSQIQNSQATIINIVNKILAKAVQQGAAAIHIEPRENCLHVRFRKDGILSYAFDPFPQEIVPAIVARLKIIANLDITERRIPQSGRIRRTYNDLQTDFFISTLPSRYGEKIVLQRFDNPAVPVACNLLFPVPETLAIVREIANHSHGLIVVTGPPESGRSTTLYSILAELNDPEINICTIDEPIRYALPNITQVQPIPEKGMDNESILRSFLQQDADVILINVPFYKEVAQLGIEAVLKGQLVLAKMFVNDSVEAIARLNEIGIEPAIISDTLVGVIAQHLIRRVCHNCAISYHPTSAELNLSGLSACRQVPETICKAKIVAVQERHAAKDRGELCPICNGVGYKGRVSVCEVLPATKCIKAAIAQRASPEKIRELAVEEGMKTFIDYSLELVFQKYTTLEEVKQFEIKVRSLESGGEKSIS